MKRIRADMVKINEGQERIRAGQKEVREKFEEISKETAKLKEETNTISKQSAANQVRLDLMFQIVKARSENDAPKDAALTQILRALINGEAEPELKRAKLPGEARAKINNLTMLVRAQYDQLAASDHKLFNDIRTSRGLMTEQKSSHLTDPKKAANKWECYRIYLISNKY
uniref:Uncharacterized protein n=1 Tax=Salix viminalis TaxID=40686 RepID=A0A6N2M7Q5_SALVM